MAGRAGHRGFGAIKRLKSGRWHASYVGPDLVRHNGPATFTAKADAEAWLAQERRLIESGDWAAPKERLQRQRATEVTFSMYANTFLTHRTLKPKTRQHYRMLLARPLATFADVPVKDITPYAVKAWHTALGDGTPTLRAHAYGLLRTILAEAVRDGLLVANPCHIRGAGNAKKQRKTKVATPEELAVMVAAMPERRRMMLVLATWCALRFGELTELRRKDVDLLHGVLRIRRGVTKVDGDYVVGTPKTDAGIRDVAVPPHLLADLEAHLAEHVGAAKDALLFPAIDGGHLSSTSFYGKAPTKTRAGHGWYAARAAAGRPDLTFHELRHTGAVWAAQTGHATLADLMGRLGHSTPGAAMRYQHAAQDRDRALAAKMSERATAHTA